MDKTPLDAIVGAIPLICEADMIGEWLLDVLFRNPFEYLPIYVIFASALGAVVTLGIREKNQVGIFSTRWKRFFFGFTLVLFVMVVSHE